LKRRESEKEWEEEEKVQARDRPEKQAEVRPFKCEKFWDMEEGEKEENKRKEWKRKLEWKKKGKGEERL
jgi:hypothetical protein